MRILEAFDLMRSFRGAAKVAGCDHQTVKRLVVFWEAGALSVEAVDTFVEHIEGWMEASHRRVRADVCHEMLVALGYGGVRRGVRGGRLRSRVADLGAPVAELLGVPWDGAGLSFARELATKPR